MNQGQSQSSLLKERGFSALFAINARIVASPRCEKAIYVAIDLNCGSGYNERADCIGSPLAWAKVAPILGSRAYAFFVDRDADAIAALKARPEMASVQCEYFCMDNAEFLRNLPQLLMARFPGRWIIGHILFDPNGADIPFDIAREVFRHRKCSCLDAIINYNTSAQLRVRLSPKLQRDVPTLAELSDIFGRKYWLISEPRPGVQKFVTLIGRRVRTGDYRKLGFVHLDSERGQRIAYECSYSNAEREEMEKKSQLSLPLLTAHTPNTYGTHAFARFAR